MGTIEGAAAPETVRSGYDGFISYSHAADDLLAPRLQSGLQRFAKPWWKRRAVRVFRDKASLSANPHLWSSITQSLDDSAWFILLLSPDAAASPWVDREVEYWLEHKSAQRIIPVLTEGEFGWESGDVSGDSFPPALSGAFSDEPRWVDMRFARTETQLDLQNPKFAEAVADVASALRGLPKDELASEEVRQHRRTMRTVWAAGIALTALAIAAAWFGVRANQQAALAERNAQAEAAARAEADTQREAAERNEATAIAEADRADQEAANASRQAQIARSREFAAAAVAALEDDPGLSMMLALQSISAAPATDQASPAGVIALRKALQANRLAVQFDLAEPTDARISPDGTTIYYSSASMGSVAAIDVATGVDRWTYETEAAGRISTSPDGALLAVAVTSLDDAAASVIVLSTEDGAVVAQVATAGCGQLGVVGFSPDGRWLAMSDGSDDCATDPDADWVSIVDTSTWLSAHRLEIPGAPAEEVRFSADSGRVLITAGFQAPSELRSFPALELINTFVNAVALSPDGEKVVVEQQRGGDPRPLLLEATSGDRIAFLDAVTRFVSGTEPVLFSPDGSVIAIATFGDGYVFDAESGRLVTRLPERGLTMSQSFTDDASVLLSSDAEGASLWRLDDTLGATGFPVHGGEMGFMNPNSVVDGPNLAVWVGVWLDGEPAYRGRLLDPATGAITGTFDGYGVQLPDGRIVYEHVVFPPEDEELFSTEDGRFGPIVVWDPATGESEPLTDCTAIKSPYTWEVGDIRCASDEVMFPYSNSPIVFGLTASPDGSVIVADSYAPEGTEKRVRVWDAATLAVRSEFTIRRGFTLVAAGSDWVAHIEPSARNLGGAGRLRIHDIDTGAILAEPGGEFFLVADQLHDDSLLVITDRTGEVFVLDTNTWEIVARWRAHAASVRGLAVSLDETRLATAAEDETVRIWDITALHGLAPGAPPPLLDEIPVPRPSDAAWLSDTRLAVFTNTGALWVDVSLDVNDLVVQARARLVRGFTPVECATYQIDPCPVTLDAIRGG